MAGYVPDIIPPAALRCRDTFLTGMLEMQVRKKTLEGIDGLPVPDVIKWLNQVLVGYFHYYGITDNSVMLSRFVQCVRKLLYKWLNRRSQRRSYTWGAFVDLMKNFPLVKPRIYVSIYGY